MKNAGVGIRSHVLNVVISTKNNAVYIFNKNGYKKMSAEVFKSIENSHTQIKY